MILKELNDLQGRVKNVVTSLGDVIDGNSDKVAALEKRVEALELKSIETNTLSAGESSMPQQ